MKFENLTLNSTRFKIWPPAWIRHFDFLNSNTGFEMSDLKNHRILIFSTILPPSWIPHFDFLESDTGFEISEPKNPLIPIFSMIRQHVFFLGPTE